MARGRYPNVTAIADLRGLVIGVQQGMTSEPVTRQLVGEGRAARVQTYAYDAIGAALDDLSSGSCDVLMKLAPVTQWFVRTRPSLRVVQIGITRELLAVCVRRGDRKPRMAIARTEAASLAREGHGHEEPHDRCRGGPDHALAFRFLREAARLPGAGFETRA